MCWPRRRLEPARPSASLIPIVEMLQDTGNAEKGGRDAQALIALPTRELAMQVEKAFRAIRSSNAQTVALVVGGMAEQTQLQTIRRGGAVERRHSRAAGRLPQAQTGAA